MTRDIRRRNAAIAGLAMIVLILLAATGAAPRDLIDIANLLIAAAIPIVIVGGLLRLLRKRGVTIQAVAGAPMIYLSSSSCLPRPSGSSPTPTRRCTTPSTPTAQRETASRSQVSNSRRLI